MLKSPSQKQLLVIFRGSNPEQASAWVRRSVVESRDEVLEEGLGRPSGSCAAVSLAECSVA